MKIATIVGARPQFIKAAVVSHALRAASVQETLIHTGQHYDDNMSEVFFRELEIAPPDFHLGIGSGLHGAQTGRMMERLEKTLLELKPDWVLVYGDTNSTLAGALAAAKIHLPVAHVEAGLRSFNRKMPEEINRVVADHLAELLFAPHLPAVENLVAEGIRRSRIESVGDVMFDVALVYLEKARHQSQILKRLGAREKEYLLATIHRAENTDDPVRLEAIWNGLTQVAAQHRIFWPVHPRTRGRLGARPVPPGLELIEPLGYLDMILLEKNARLIVTDSGGVQKEAYFHRVPCVTLRDETEWNELVTAGWNRLAPPQTASKVASAILEALGTTGEEGTAFYGDGHAAQKIAARLAKAQLSQKA